MYIFYNSFSDYKIGDAFGAKQLCIQLAEVVSSNIVPLEKPDLIQFHLLV